MYCILCDAALLVEEGLEVQLRKGEKLMEHDSATCMILKKGERYDGYKSTFIHEIDMAFAQRHGRFATFCL